MKAQIDVWEKDNAQSSQSFAQNLDEKIKETETKLDKLVNAFLDGSIEKETYLVKKDELIKTKTDLPTLPLLKINNEGCCHLNLN